MAEISNKYPENILGKFSLIGWSYESEEPGMSDSGVDLYFRIDGKEHKIAANSVY